jgi:hypothetical protein
VKAITWRMDATVLGMSLLTIADAAAFWSANNPSFMTVRSFTTAGGNKAETVRTDIKIGSLFGTGETVVVGFGAALISRSWWPLVLPGAYLALKWAQYRWALDHPHGHAETIADQGERAPAWRHPAIGRAVG